MQQSIEKKQIPSYIKASAHQPHILLSSDKKNIEKIADQGIEKVREILFGSQIRNHEQQILAAESKNQDNLKDLRQVIFTRLDDFEVLFKSEIKNLSYRIKSEHESRLHSEEKNQTELSDLKNLFIKRTQSLTEEIAASKNQCSVDFKKDLDLLGQQKVERSQFSTFMTDWAQRFENRAEANSGHSK